MISIRLAKNADLKQIAKIFIASYKHIEDDEKWDLENAHKLINHFYNAQKDLFFIAEENGQIVGGIVALIKPWWDGNHLTDGEFIVHPTHQKKGIGAKLINHLFLHAQKKYNAVSWDTFTFNENKHPLTWYKKIGFKEIEKWIMISGNVKEVLKKVKK